MTKDQQQSSEEDDEQERRAANIFHLVAAVIPAACSLSDISGWRAGVLYPLAGGRRESGAAHLDLLGPPGWCSGCWPHDGDVAGGAGFLFSDIAVRGRRWSSGDRSDRRCGGTGSTAPTARIESRVEGALRRALSPTFPAGEMVFFIPWRVVAEDSGAAHLDLLGPPGWCSGCWPHEGDVAGGAVDFHLVIFRFGAADGARAIGANDAAAAVELRGRRRRPP